MWPHWGRVRAPESQEGLSGFKWELEVASPLELDSSEMREKRRQTPLSFLGLFFAGAVVWGGPLLGLESQAPAPGSPLKGTELEAPQRVGPGPALLTRGQNEEAPWSSQPTNKTGTPERGSGELGGTIYTLSPVPRSFENILVPSLVSVPWGLSPVSKGCKKA